MLTKKEILEKKEEVWYQCKSDFDRGIGLCSLISQIADQIEELSPQPPLLVGLDPDGLIEKKNEIFDKYRTDFDKAIFLCQFINEIADKIRQQGEQFVVIKTGHLLCILDKYSKTIRSGAYSREREEDADAECARLNAEVKKKKEEPKYRFSIRDEDCAVINKEGMVAGYIYGITPKEAKDEIRKWIESE